MSSEEARRRLSLYRCSEAELGDPFFKEAVAQATAEPVLAHWWAEQRAIDALLARRLRELSTPADVLSTLTPPS